MRPGTGLLGPFEQGTEEPAAARARVGLLRRERQASARGGGSERVRPVWGRRALMEEAAWQSGGLTACRRISN